MPRLVVATNSAIDEAAQLIRNGDIVGIPTETVYGVAANALDTGAVEKIFQAKERPSFNPLIVHVSTIAQAADLVDLNDQAKKVIDAFWPGPLTLILPAKKDNGISPLVSAGLDTLAVRMPAHKIAQAVIKKAGVPIAAPSANRSGEPSATTPHHVAQSLGDNIDFILAAGACQVGLESTVLDLSGDKPTILRPGAITVEDLAPYLGDVAHDTAPKEQGQTIKSPGQLLKHYAPSIPVRLNAVDVKQGEALLAFGSIQFMGVEGGGAAKDLPDSRIRNLSEGGDMDEAARHLFMMLRDLDRPEHAAIAVMNIPHTAIGCAINERLTRAAKNNV